jgi:hypothetical protein
MSDMDILAPKELSNEITRLTEAWSSLSHWFLWSMKTMVGGLEPWNFEWLSHHIGIIIPTDFHSIIFQRGRSTTNQKINETMVETCWNYGSYDSYDYSDGSYGSSLPLERISFRRIKLFEAIYGVAPDIESGTQRPSHALENGENA